MSRNGSSNAGRIVRSYTQFIRGTPDRVFELLCPVREAEWLHGWDYRMVYSESGLAEEGCVFTSRAEGEAETLWMITRRDAAARVIEFVRFTPGSRVAKLEIAVRNGEPGCSLVDIRYTFTALTGEGERFLEAFTQENFEASMRFWEDAMNHYLETGERLVPEEDS